MVYEAGRGLFPLHNDEPHVLNKFRVSISFSPEMPNFAMRFKKTKNVFEIRRGALTIVVMDMHGAGRQEGRGQRGLIEHGTLQQSTHDAVFFVFDVEAENWAEMLQKNIAFVTLLSEFSEAAPGWTATVQQTVVPWVPEPEGQLKPLYQFNSIQNGAAIKTTLAIAADLIKSNSSSSSSSGSGESASKKQRTADTRDVTSLEAADFATADKCDVPYGADALKEQQLYKLAKLAKAAAQAEKKEEKKEKKAEKQRKKEAAKKAKKDAKEAKKAAKKPAYVYTAAQRLHKSNMQRERRAGRTKEKKKDDNLQVACRRRRKRRGAGPSGGSSQGPQQDNCSCPIGPD